ncbi:hypothetical protein GCM10007858_21670 [Bradyrhizobium liaoningense]|nr:hypothetical protein GCM10007858_21670 [Bradyrhizobium liaoningense]
MSGCAQSPFVGGPRQHPAVGADIIRIDKTRPRKIGQRSFGKSEPPSSFGAENEAVSCWWRRNSNASIGVFVRRRKLLRSQRLGCEAFERDMRVRPDKQGNIEILAMVV